METSIPTREEIREGIAKHLAEFDGRDWEELTSESKGTYIGRATVLACHLHSQGVVLKVERELPSVTHSSNSKSYDAGFYHGMAAYSKAVVEAGYCAVEPLIEKKPLGAEARTFPDPFTGPRMC